MKKFTMLFVLALFFKIAVSQVTVNITVMNNLSPSMPVSGASVTINGAATPTVLSDANGLATFTVPTPLTDTSYTLVITAPGYINYTSTWDVNIKTTDGTVNSTVYIKAAYSTQFTVTDGTNPIPNASIRLVSTWPVFDQTFVTDAQGIVLTDKLFPQWTSVTYTISADGFADSTGTANIQNTDLVVDPIALKRAYIITFTVNDGTNPLMDASVIINNINDFTILISSCAKYCKSCKYLLIEFNILIFISSILSTVTIVNNSRI